MWTLSTDTVVGMQMKELALKCVVEHPSRSLILDLEDETWSEYFTQDELEEICTHRNRGLIPSPLDLQSYLDSLSQNDDIESMLQELFSHYYNPTINPSCYWAQRSLIDGLDLIRSGFFRSLGGHSERDFVTRIWRIMLTSFDYSRIMAREEIHSDACSNEMNKGRRLGSAAPLVRKKSSKRPDHLYSFEEKELGFLEAAKKCDQNGNKEYKDACLKSPKTMKDFLLQFTKHNPDLIHAIHVPCLITSGLDVKMLLLDCPQGFVCRVVSTETNRYPSSYLTYVSDITPCLELGWMMKSILEETLSTLITPTRRAIQMKRKRRFEVPSSFVRGNKRPSNNNATLPHSSRS